jgi:hypothetical protein
MTDSDVDIDYDNDYCEEVKFKSSKATSTKPSVKQGKSKKLSGVSFKTRQKKKK